MAILPLNHNPGISLVVVLSMAKMTTLPLWRTMSRVASLPPGSINRVAKYSEERPLEDCLGADEFSCSLYCRHERLGSLLRLGLGAFAALSAFFTLGLRAFAA